MSYSFEHILNKHKGEVCIVALHGSSLDPHKEQIEDLQKENKAIRISTNEWFNYFSEKPDYWIVSNGEFTIKASIDRDHIWDSRGYPHNVFNEQDVFLIYNKTADLTNPEFIKENLKCDYHAFDSKHFKGHSCKQILNNFRDHYTKNKNLNYCDYGKNPQMWQKPNVAGFPPWFQQIHGKIAQAWDPQEKCCANMGEITFQEKLQGISGHSRHMGPGQTVGLMAIAYAVMMGCSKIYVAGLDLDYSLGYAGSINGTKDIPNIGNIGHWKYVFKDFLLDDMRILNESAELLGTKIINLNKEAWYNEFEKGDLEK